MTEFGFCRCGCGQRTGIAQQTQRTLGRVAVTYALAPVGAQRERRKAWQPNAAVSATLSA